MNSRTETDVRLQDEHAVVTGAGGGLGRALCHELVRCGAEVSALDIDESALRDLVSSDASGRLFAHAVDITDATATAEVIEQLREERGPIDLVVNNAGITHFSTVEDVALKTIEQVMAVNFTGSVNCTKAALPDLLDRAGQVVVLSSVAGFAPLFGRCAYSASKHALHGFFETLRCEVRDRGVNVLMVCPSFIDTQRDQPDAESPYEGVARPGSARATVGEVKSPEAAAREIVDAIARREERLLVGRVAKQSYWLRRLLPRLYDSMMTRRARAEVAR
jgi:NAD(P)-dependent dehydrogenase (short-subunit alcohol dehydrogenase family)